MSGLPPMPGDEISKELLIKQIEAAFANVNREGAESLHQASAIEQRASEKEVEAAGKLDTDKHWTDIPGPLLEQHMHALGFFDVKGWLYHLPAYMRWSILRVESGCELYWPDEVSVSALMPPDEFRDKNKKKKADPRDPRFEALTKSHKRVCARFLRYMGWQQGDIGAMYYYQEYWRQFDF